MEGREAKAGEKRSPIKTLRTTAMTVGRKRHNAQKHHHWSGFSLNSEISQAYCEGSFRKFALLPPCKWTQNPKKCLLPCYSRNTKERGAELAWAVSEFISLPLSNQDDFLLRLAMKRTSPQVPLRGAKLFGQRFSGEWGRCSLI